jgi:hypothetical protein
MTYERDAVLSPCGVYRYRLWRKWAEGLTVLWVLLNPSTADALVDDRTTMRCRQFSRSWGFGSMWLGNLYAYRATKPEWLPASMAQCEGPDNMQHLEAMRALSSMVVFGWGNYGPAKVPLAWPGAQCLGKTKLGSPRHPLYLETTAPLELV